jgi:hypothetical protein
MLTDSASLVGLHRTVPPLGGPFCPRTTRNRESNVLVTELEHGAEWAGAHTEVAEVVAGATVQILADQAAHARCG